MRIRFEFQGGYGGLFAAKPLAHEVDTARVPDDVRTELVALIERAGLLGDAPPEPAPEAARARDAVNYRLWLEDERGSRSLAYSDVGAPPAVRPLLQYLQKLALEERAKGG